MSCNQNVPEKSNGQIQQGVPCNSRSKNSRLKKVQKCLSKLASKLIVKSYEGSNHLFWMMFLTIKASQLNTSDCWLAAQHPFEGILGRKKIGICDITSISLFIDDVECLLREEYDRGSRPR